ncbi:hypothetical protein QCE73_25000 [Caballeronia sp. LZ029]|uniref:hypothetical protein n=1 Tax=Caballeronia sp. LZ029 TaxID=3038564 RepID=UPI0028543354|nr:hypothetical protein [Caballeronia sp. LZ029]MDR5746434.1 hypothetical protein [Caballeronia sp. LZ029]
MSSLISTAMISLLLLLGTLSNGLAETKPDDGSPICLQSEKYWASEERALWRSICETSGYIPVGGTTEFQLTLSGSFIKDLFTKHPYRDNIENHGHLFLENFRTTDGVDLEAPQDGKSIYLILRNFSTPFINISGHTVEIYNVKTRAIGISNVPRLEIHGLRSDDGCSLPTVIAKRTKISGSVYLSNSQIGELSLRRANVENFSVVWSSVRSIDTNGAIIRERLIFHHTELGGSPIKHGDPRGSDCEQKMKIYSDPSINFERLHARSLEIIDSKIYSTLRVDDTILDDMLSFEGSGFLSAVRVRNSSIKGTFYLGIGTLDWDSNKPGPARSTSWARGTSLSLANSDVNRIYAPRNTSIWPSEIDFQNTQYQSFVFSERQLGGASKAERSGLQIPELGAEEFFIEFASRFPDPQNPEPYFRLQTYLASIGQSGAARQLGIAAKEGQRKHACASGKVSQCLFLWIMRVTIGYGYSLWLAGVWSCAFVIIGAVVFRNTPEAKQRNMPYGLAYSFDTFIPLIKLRDMHYDIDIKSAARYYFYFHKLAGWILGTFLVAAVSGLTK